MPKNTTSHIKGRVAELELIKLLELQGFPTVDISSRDYGVDLSAQVPTEILGSQDINKINNYESGESFEMSATFVHLQVKSTHRKTIKTEHLGQWSAANERGLTHVLVFVRKNYAELYSPTAIRDAYFAAVHDGVQTLSMEKFKNDSVTLPIGTRAQFNSNRLGLALRSFMLYPIIEFDVNSLIKMKRGDSPSFQQFLNNSEELFKGLVLARYPVGRTFNQAFDDQSVSHTIYEHMREIERTLNSQVNNSQVPDKFESIMYEKAIEIAENMDYFYQTRNFVELDNGAPLHQGASYARTSEEFQTLLNIIKKL